MSNCRICGRIENSGSEYSSGESLIWYSKRHAVHASCGMQKWGAEFFDRLTPKQCYETLPYLLVKKLGLEEAFDARINSKEPTLRVQNTFSYKLKQQRLSAN